MGKKAELISKLTDIIPNLDFTDDSWGVMEGDGFSIEFNMGDKEDVDANKAKGKELAKFYAHL